MPRIPEEYLNSISPKIPISSKKDTLDLELLTELLILLCGKTPAVTQVIKKLDEEK